MDTYGETGFKEIFTIAKEIQNKLKGEMILSEYENALKEHMKPEEIKSDLYLFIAILKFEENNDSH